MHIPFFLSYSPTMKKEEGRKKEGKKYVSISPKKRREQKGYVCVSVRSHTPEKAALMWPYCRLLERGPREGICSHIDFSPLSIPREGNGYAAMLISFHPQGGVTRPGSFTPTPPPQWKLALKLWTKGAKGA